MSLFENGTNAVSMLRLVAHSCERTIVSMLGVVVARVERAEM